MRDKIQNQVFDDNATDFFVRDLPQRTKSLEGQQLLHNERIALALRNMAERIKKLEARPVCKCSLEAT